MARKKIDLDNWTPVDSSNPLKSLAHEVNSSLDAMQATVDAITPATGVMPGYKGVRVDDGVPVQLDNIIVQLNPGNPRSLQFKVATGTLSVGISGVIYWTNNGNGIYESKYWTGNTLNTSWQQIFGWSFPWANDNAIYNVQDLTNGRFYRITLSIGPGYKNNFIIMERLV